MIHDIPPSMTGCYLDFQDSRCVLFDSAVLAAFTERHLIRLDHPSLIQHPDILNTHEARAATHWVIAMEFGVPGRIHLNTAQRGLKLGKKIFFYWPIEQAVECIDAERLASYRRLWAFKIAYWGAQRLRALLATLYQIFIAPITRALRAMVSLPMRMARHAANIFRTTLQPPPPPPEPTTTESIQAPPPPRHDLNAEVVQALHQDLDQTIAAANPVPFPKDWQDPKHHPIAGCGVYMRLDFWNHLTAGGSYGHTCYVAKELAAVSWDFLCIMGAPYPLLDDMGLRQFTPQAPGRDGNTENILRATHHFLPSIKIALQAVRPAFIYERTVLGNWAGAKLSQQLGIPYIVEYNGSEISMRRSFDNYVPDPHEDLYLKAELAAFRQATMISVVSEMVKNDLVNRGIDPHKILINPNGVDPEAYQPAPSQLRSEIRQELGFSDTHSVIGMIGTFGGWHGIDILAQAIPLICAQSPHARFLMIGDGNLKHLIDKAIVQHHLQERVICVGKVPQAEGARLLKACDILVSPHNSHMVDSRFFGSPTKLFEYMAMQAAIVASDLEQLGLVLSPALTPEDLNVPDLQVNQQRAVLCTPGHLEQFVAAVIGLIEQPHIAHALAKNARQAALDHYSWVRHVARLRLFAAGERDMNILLPDLTYSVDPKAPVHRPPDGADESDHDTPTNTIDTAAVSRFLTGDAYKDETQNQWNRDPCGSQYVKEAELHTLEWFLEVERYRYDEYGPWMPEVMEFDQHAGKQLLEIGAGIGTDLSQFAKHGAIVTDVDLAGGHLELAKRNFQLRGLNGRFIHHDAEHLPLEDNSFDVVYSNGVIHHTPNTKQVVSEIFRVLKPGGKAIIMVYAENSWHYWNVLVRMLGLEQDLFAQCSIGEVMSRHVELSSHGSKPLVKVYTKPRLRALFSAFDNISICQRQMVPAEWPGIFSWISVENAGRMMGWNLIIKAHKPIR